MNYIDEFEIPKSSSELELEKIKEAEFKLEKKIISLRLKYRLSNKWARYLVLAEAYFNKHKHLDVPRKFRTTNGYDEDPNSPYDLGAFILRQREIRKGIVRGSLTPAQIMLLDESGMIWEKKSKEESWMEYYNLVKEYHYFYNKSLITKKQGLKIKRNFKTFDGINYHKKGKNIYKWFLKQRNNKDQLSEQQIALLDELEADWDKKGKYSWEECYKAAVEYRNKEIAKFGTDNYRLRIPQRFITENGMKLGSWAIRLRQLYKGQAKGILTQERIKMLEDINFEWFSESADIKAQSDEINDYNNHAKKIEILNRMKSVLNEYTGDSLPTPEELNKTFMLKLNREKKAA